MPNSNKKLLKIFARVELPAPDKPVNQRILVICKIFKIGLFLMELTY